MPRDNVAEWVMARVSDWRVARDNDHRDAWRDYYRLWRGIWEPESRTNAAERSRAIMPALSQAVESAVAELQEAVLGREVWFDVRNPEFSQLSQQLLIDTWHLRASLQEVFLLGALYGTGIAKIVIDSTNPFRQRLQPLDPFEFVPDPSADNIDDALGVAHDMLVPRNVVERRQREGIYRQVALEQGSPQVLQPDVRPGELGPRHPGLVDSVRLVEWHGLVPAEFVDSDEEPIGDESLVEAIVTVADDTTVLRAEANPMGADRGFVAYQHDIVPRRFWGRGVMEKGYWPQKVLDSEIRARIDALSLSTAPMLAINSLMLPRGETFQVRPGRNIFMQGPIAGNVEPLRLPPPDPQTYQQSSDMQRMVELGTGQLQVATPLGIDTRNAPASGVSMILGASVRRTKRALANIERQFLDPLLRKLLRRHLEFDDGYPNDVALSDRFTPRFLAGQGMMARELELTQMAQLMATLGPGPAQLGLLRVLVEHSSLLKKDEALAVIDQQLAQAVEQGQQDISGQARMISAVSRAEEGAARIELEASKLQLQQAQIESLERDRGRRHQEEMTKASLDAFLKESQIALNNANAVAAVAKAEAQEVGSQIEQLRAIVETLTAGGTPQ